MWRPVTIYLALGIEFIRSFRKYPGWVGLSAVLSLSILCWMLCWKIFQTIMKLIS